MVMSAVEWKVTPELPVTTLLPSVESVPSGASNEIELPVICTPGFTTILPSLLDKETNPEEGSARTLPLMVIPKSAVSWMLEPP